MAFRDDHEALRAKTRALEEEVEALNAKFEKVERRLGEHAERDHEDATEISVLQRRASELDSHLRLLQHKTPREEPHVFAFRMRIPGAPIVVFVAVGLFGRSYVVSRRSS